jgi:PhnB protein
MTVQLNAYLHFADQAREAMGFYRDVFGGTLEMNTYAEFGMSGSPANDDRTMHSQLVTDHGLVLMGADAPEGMDAGGTGISLSLSGDDEPTLRGFYDALAEGGKVVEPLEKAPWGDHFGACVDRFGVSWMVNIGSAPG